MKMWMPGLRALSTARSAASTSSSRVRERLTTVGRVTASAIRWTDSKSPGEEAAKPPSMISTPRRSSWRAIASFSSTFIVQPGDCSPSRSVVSKMRT